MSFNCEHCGKDIQNGDDGDFQGCDHYPVVQLILRSHREGFNRVEEVDGELRHIGARHIISDERDIHIQPHKGCAGYITPTLSYLFADLYKPKEIYIGNVDYE